MKYVTVIVAKVRLPANFKLIQSYHWCIIYCCLMFFLYLITFFMIGIVMLSLKVDSREIELIVNMFLGCSL